MTMHRFVTLVLVGLLTASAAQAQSLSLTSEGRVGATSEARPYAATILSPHPVGAVQRHIDPTWPSLRDDGVLAVTSASVVEGGSRQRHVVLGAAVGALAGLVVYAVDQHGCRSTNGIPCAVGAGSELMILVGGGVLVGALVGAVLPHGS